MVMSLHGYGVPINNEFSAFAINNYLSRYQKEAYNVHVDSLLRNYIGNVLLATEAKEDLQTARLILDIVDAYPGAGKNLGEIFFMEFLKSPTVELNNYLKKLLKVVEENLGEIFFKCASTQKNEYYEIPVLIEILTAFYNLLPHLPNSRYSFNHFLPYDQGGKEVLTEIMRNPECLEATILALVPPSPVQLTAVPVPNLVEFIAKKNLQEGTQYPPERARQFQEHLKALQELSLQATFLNKLAVYLNNLKYASSSKIDFTKLSFKNSSIAKEALELLATYSDCTMKWKAVVSQLAEIVQQAMLNDFMLNFHEDRQAFWEKYLDPSGRGLLHYLSELIQIDLNPVQSNHLMGRHRHTVQKVRDAVTLHIDFQPEESASAKLFQEMQVRSEEASLGLEKDISELAIKSLSASAEQDNFDEMDEQNYQDFLSQFSFEST
jgi:hypothetical protein